MLHKNLTFNRKEKKAKQRVIAPENWARTNGDEMRALEWWYSCIFGKDLGCSTCQGLSNDTAKVNTCRSP